MSIRIVGDSAADIHDYEGIEYAVAALKITTSEKEYVDDRDLDVDMMVDALEAYKGKSGTACPGPGDWIDAFGDAEEVFCVTITSGLSGSYNSACVAKEQYEEQYPGRKVCVVDSLSAGPEMMLIVDKIKELHDEGKTFEEISEAIMKYKNNTGLVFMLKSLKNLASNGRVSVVVAKAIGLIGIKLVGKASDEGKLEPTDKIRSDKKVISAIVDRLKEYGYKGGRIIISHCRNEEMAMLIKKAVKEVVSGAEIIITKTHGLCSYYAEKGGILIGFEKGVTA